MLGDISNGGIRGHYQWRTTQRNFGMIGSEPNSGIWLRNEPISLEGHPNTVLRTRARSTDQDSKDLGERPSRSRS